MDVRKKAEKRTKKLLKAMTEYVIYEVLEAFEKDIMKLNFMLNYVIDIKSVSKEDLKAGELLWKQKKKKEKS